MYYFPPVFTFLFTWIWNLHPRNKPFDFYSREESGHFVILKTFTYMCIHVFGNIKDQSFRYQNIIIMVCATICALIKIQKEKLFLVWCFAEVKTIFGFSMNCFALLLELKAVNYVLEICIYLSSGLWLKQLLWSI